MRSNYSPYPQLANEQLTNAFSELEMAKRQVQQANENFIKIASSQVPLMLRHHTASRPLVKIKLAQVKSELQASNNARIAGADQVYAEAMADIESKRADYHSKEEATAQAQRAKKLERATLTYDNTMQQYYVMRADQVTGADGIVRPVMRKVYLPADHEYLK